MQTESPRRYNKSQWLGYGLEAKRFCSSPQQLDQLLGTNQSTFYGTAQRTCLSHATWTYPQEGQEGCVVTWLHAVIQSSPVLAEHLHCSAAVIRWEPLCYPYQ